MTETLRRAAHNTKVILNHADRARALLSADGPRSNAAGVLSDPGDYLRALKVARELIGQAIAVHAETAWPDESDYHAL